MFKPGEYTDAQRWAHRYVRCRDAVELAYAIHHYGRIIGRWLVR